MAKQTWFKDSGGWIPVKNVWYNVDGVGWVGGNVPKIKEVDGNWYDCMPGQSTLLTLGMSAIPGYTFDYYAEGAEDIGYDIYGQHQYRIYNGNTVTVKLQVTGIAEGETNVHGQITVMPYYASSDTYQLYSWIGSTWVVNINDGDVFCDGFVDNNTEF